MGILEGLIINKIPTQLPEANELLGLAIDDFKIEPTNEKKIIF